MHLTTLSLLACLILAQAFGVEAIGSKPTPSTLPTGTTIEGHSTDVFVGSAPLRVVAFLGVDCPLSKLYVTTLNELQRDFEHADIEFVAVFSNEHDSNDELRTFASSHDLGLRSVVDQGQAIADHFTATRITEVVLVTDGGRELYRGRIDDRYSVESRRAASVNDYLRDAIVAALGGSTETSATEPVGCIISRKSLDRSANQEVTYRGQIAKLLDNRCRSCHRAGQSAPFSLETYDDAESWGESMLEQIEQKRMPPWHADSEPGYFSNDKSMTQEERELFATWVENGMPEGQEMTRPIPPKFPGDWAIGEPDKIVVIPEPFQVPAEGIIEYHIVDVDPGFEVDTWVTAGEVRPSNPAVLHHCNVFLVPPGSEGIVSQGTLGSICLLAHSVGTPPTQYPKGMAKLVPKGWKLRFVLHYVTIGRPQVDRTQLGLRLVSEQAVKHEVATQLLWDDAFEIPAGAPAHLMQKKWIAPRDVLLLSMFPHMHLRGKAFQYELVSPSGACETLLSVPNYDFNWQNQYILAKPRRIPRGWMVRCTATYDNSSQNEHNPDPTTIVRVGPRVVDEMFNGYFDVVDVDERVAWRINWFNAGVLAITGAVVVVAGRYGMAIYSSFRLLWRRGLRVARRQQAH